ncbi:hypothetical protein QAD02_011294 [Eretmocerus hayati]|uniref:Uncharacterized protein n=1 Tax=Eretmocerus hayati TaxID=131215 RepID=A0ACC2NXC5_9HYME|nr:hypothetical protein QAD02_011294 [Eretmocerus hayati]
MMKLYLIVISSQLLCNFEIGNGANASKTYVKSPPSAAVVQNTESHSKLKEIVIEGQTAPHQDETILSVPERFNSSKEVVKKGSKARKGAIDKSAEKIDPINSKTVIVPLETVNNRKNMTLPAVKKLPVNVSKVSKNFDNVNLSPVSEVILKGAEAEVKKPVGKPKPVFTESDGKAPDGPIPASPTRASLSTPSKIDYIVPAAITLTALPLLGAAFLVLYRRGRDYWDKRHYRRMDFLIDGMYNE